jgi:hypothetical protein
VSKTGTASDFFSNRFLYQVIGCEELFQGKLISYSSSASPEEGGLWLAVSFSTIGTVYQSTAGLSKLWTSSLQWVFNIIIDIFRTEYTSQGVQE